MPRETIHSDQQFNVSVGWWPDRDVQVGVTTTQGLSLLNALYGHPATVSKIGKAAVEVFGLDDTNGFDYANCGAAVLRLVEDAGDHPYEGIWSTLGNRMDPNRLIKVLRKARDAAFGRDE
jgi:hypothetical protein